MKIPNHHRVIGSFLFISLFSVSILNAQSIDLADDFLDSLDPNLREEIESATDKKEDLELQKLFNAEASIKTNKAILEGIKKQINDLDIRLREASGGDADGLEVYGRKFFSSLQSTFMPINIPNFGSNYMIDVGDEFILLLTGKINKEHTLEVQRDGSLVIPSVGKISVAGMSLKEANTSLGNLLDNTMLGVDHHLALSEVRDIQVLLLGGIQSPGVYSLSGGSNLLHALNVAGGIAENGSYRKVDLIRDSKVKGTYDLYDIFTLGSFDPTATLRSGDSVYVHPRSFLVPITGGVNQEALYEILPDETLGKLIGFAGGLSPSFDGFNQVKVNSIDLDGVQIKDINIKEFNTYKLRSRDSVLVPAYESEGLKLLSANIEGMVKKPGKYFFQEGETLSDLVKRAGGYKEGAYTYGAALFRKRAIDLEKQYSRRNYKDIISFITSSIGKPGVNVNAAAIDVLAEEAQASEYIGRIITDFNLSNLSKDPSKDVILESGDSLVIPDLDKIVYMFGDFANPSNVGFSTSMKVKDYINQAGGLKDTALDRVYVIDPDGRAHIFYANRLFSRNNVSIYPGSIIYAPKDVGKLQGIEFAGTFAPILSSLALSLASLNSINN